MKGAEMLRFMAHSTLSAAGVSAVRCSWQHLHRLARQHLYCPEVTMRSPGDRPFSISARPPSIGPTVTLRSSAFESGVTT